METESYESQMNGHGDSATLDDSQNTEPYSNTSSPLPSGLLDDIVQWDLDVAEHNGCGDSGFSEATLQKHNQATKRPHSFDNEGSKGCKIPKYSAHGENSTLSITIPNGNSDGDKTAHSKHTDAGNHNDKFDYHEPLSPDVQITGCVAAPHDSSNDIVIINGPAATGSDGARGFTHRSESVELDASTIISILGPQNIDLVYEKLARHGGLGNRVDIVINELLEEQTFSSSAFTPTAGPVPSCSQSTTSTSVVHSSSSGINYSVASGSASTSTTSSSPAPVLGRIARDVEGACDQLKASLLDSRTNTTATRALLANHIQEITRLQDELDTVIRLQEDAEKIEQKAMAEDVEHISSKFKEVDTNHIMIMLEERRGKKDRVKMVISDLKKQIDTSKAPEAGDEVTVGGTGNNEQDQLVNEMETISKILPDIDKNEIYAYLEAHFNSHNRIQIVTEELLRQAGDIPPNSQETSSSIETPKPKEDDSSNSANIISAALNNAKANGEIDDLQSLTQVQKDMETLKELFPDCDPVYFFQMLQKHEAVPDRVTVISTQMFENKNYPKYSDRLAKMKKDDMKKKLQNLELNMKEFLQMFPDPKEVFYNEEKQVSDLYKQHALAQLKNMLPIFHADYISKTLNQHKGHFTPAIKALQQEMETFLTGISFNNINIETKYV